MRQHDSIMRTTLDLDPSVLQVLRARGRKEGKSMGRLASELLAGSLARHDANHTPSPVKWHSRDLGVPLIDLEDKEALRAALAR